MRNAADQKNTRGARALADLIFDLADDCPLSPMTRA
jgi:hypothetical protein